MAPNAVLLNRADSQTAGSGRAQSGRRCTLAYRGPDHRPPPRDGVAPDDRPLPLSLSVELLLLSLVDDELDELEELDELSDERAPDRRGCSVLSDELAVDGAGLLGAVSAPDRRAPPLLHPPPLLVG
jgi:hypothetical protein